MHQPLTFRHVSDSLLSVENNQPPSTMYDAFGTLRPLGFEDFAAVLWSMPDERFPEFTKVLPAMASDDAQKLWTGEAGYPLLQKSLNFVRTCAAAYADAQGQGLAGKRILDFGCGYGRFLRLFSYYSDDVFGVDPWEKSIEECSASGFGDRVRLSQAVPEDLPFEGPFDFLFSFSVFTHLSERSTIACLKALRAVAADNALLMITVRPVEFWELAAEGHTHLPADPEKMEQCIAKHQETGFVYYSLDEENETHYGDTTLSLDWLMANAPGWEFVSVDRSLNDAYQRYVLLRAV